MGQRLELTHGSNDVREGSDELIVVCMFVFLLPMLAMIAIPHMTPMANASADATTSDEVVASALGRATASTPEVDPVSGESSDMGPTSTEESGG